MMMGFIGITTGDRRILINIGHIVTVEAIGNGLVLTYEIGRELHRYDIPDVTLDQFCGGLSAAASTGIAMPRDMVEAMVERATKDELDS